MFESRYHVDYQGVMPDLRITFPHLMAYMLETSLQHTDSTSYPMKWYAENGFGFLLTGWQVEVFSYPYWNDEILIRTWPILFKGILAERFFEVTDCRTNSVAARANAGWVYTDIKTRKPARPAKDLVEGYGEIRPTPLERDYKLPDYSCYETLSVHSHTVTRRDTDSNMHVNNSKYLEWALDYIPGDVYANTVVREMKTVYKKECAEGAAVTIETLRDPENPFRFVTRIKNGEQLLTEIYTLWGFC